ncbi:MAG: methionyl-tRNA formyltransferase [Proteobacteria bacterium]|nr:methionyl-tRNA formyltransferase [Pseudomonadota bacterium]
MGTPDFAVASLKALNKIGCEVILVVTQPDRPKGRGRKVIFSPVKEVALELGYNIVQPASVKTSEFSDMIAALSPDLFVVIAFGHILPKNILAIPKKGAINLHASLLPKYRGPAPIQWAVMNREKKTGITAMLMDKGLDTGDILMTAEIDISPKDTSSLLHDRLALAASDLLIKTISGMEANTITPVPQDNSLATYAPLLKKKDGYIDWSKSAEDIEAFIRGINPWPGAFTINEKKRLKIFAADVISSSIKQPPGTVVGETREHLFVATGSDLLSIKEIQEESGKRHYIKDYLCGCNITPGTILGYI